MKQVVFQSTAMGRIYSPRGEKIGFVGVMELKSDMETVGTPEIQGTDHEETTDSDLLLPIITKYHGIDTKGLH